MNIGLNSLNNPSINGLQSLNLDSLSVNTMDGDLFYIDRIEAQEIIVDSKLSLTSTGVISVGNTTISDIELTYLDGVTSNIQQQITNNSNNNSGLTSTINTHTTLIAALQTSDTSQNSTLSTHTSQISALQTSDASQNTQINDINYVLYGQSTSITTLNNSDTALNNFRDKSSFEMCFVFQSNVLI